MRTLNDLKLLSKRVLLKRKSVLENVYEVVARSDDSFAWLDAGVSVVVDSCAGAVLVDGYMLYIAHQNQILAKDFYVDVVIEPEPEPEPELEPVVGLTPIVFPLNDMWYTEVVGSPVHPMSEIWKSPYKNATLRPEFGSSSWENVIGGIPYNIVKPGQALTKVFVQNLEGWERDYTDLYPAYEAMLPIPLDALRENLPGLDENNYDHDKHLIVVELDETSQPKRIYEMWEAKKRFEGGIHVGWNCQHISIFDCNKTNPQRPILKTSADAAGLSIMPALFTWEDVENAKNKSHPDDRHLGHAFRFTLPTGWIQKAFMLPATNWTPSNVANSNMAPFGARLRLKESFDLWAAMPSWYKEDANNGHIDLDRASVFVNTLKRYGMILCDNGGTLFIVGCPDFNNKWNDTELASVLECIKASDMDYIDGKVYSKSNINEAVADTGLSIWDV